MNEVLQVASGIVCVAITAYLIVWLMSWMTVRKLAEFDRESRRLWRELDAHMPGSAEYEAAFERLETFLKKQQ